VTAQLRAELLKQRSTRTSLGLLLSMLALVLLAILVQGFGLGAEDLARRNNQLSVFGRGELLGVLFAALFGALSITGEFRQARSGRRSSRCPGAAASWRPRSGGAR
jgi:hypothetical protein